MIRFFVSAALLWFVIIWVMQDHDFGWGACILWSVAATLASLGTHLFMAGLFPDKFPFAAHLLIALVYIAVLGAFVWFRFSYKGPAKVALVMGIFFVVETALGLALQ